MSKYHKCLNCNGYGSKEYTVTHELKEYGKCYKCEGKGILDENGNTVNPYFYNESMHAFILRDEDGKK